MKKLKKDSLKKVLYLSIFISENTRRLAVIAASNDV